MFLSRIHKIKCGCVMAFAMAGMSVFVTPSASVLIAQTSPNKTAQQKKAPAKKKGNEIKNLQDKQNALHEKMKQTVANIETARTNTKEAIREVDRLKEGIARKEQIIKSKTREIDSLNAKVESLGKDIFKRELDLQRVKGQYVDLIYHAYIRSGSYSKLVFILSAPTFQETYRRFRYIQRFAEMRRRQAEDIEKSKKELVKRKKELEGYKTKTVGLLSERANEQKNMMAEKEKQDKLVASLMTKEKELTADLEKQQKAADALATKIQQIIEQQAKEAALAEAKRNKSKANNANKTATSQKEDDSNSAFAKAKGKLPMPVASAKITGHYGPHQHPVLQHVVTNNKGIYLTAGAGAVAKAVFDGEVKQRFSIPGSNNAVIVRHDNYLSVYSNLTNVYVKNGDKVVAGQKIGKVYEDEKDGNRATLFFQIWKEKELQNPELWLKKQ